MAISCDPCECPAAYYRDEMSFRKAVLVVLSQATGPLSNPDCDPGLCPQDWIGDEQKWRQGVLLLLCALAAIVNPPA